MRSTSGTIQPLPLQGSGHFNRAISETLGFMLVTNRHIRTRGQFEYIEYWRIAKQSDMDGYAWLTSLVKIISTPPLVLFSSDRIRIPKVVWLLRFETRSHKPDHFFRLYNSSAQKRPR